MAHSLWTLTSEIFGISISAAFAGVFWGTYLAQTAARTGRTTDCRPAAAGSSLPWAMSVMLCGELWTAGPGGESDCPTDGRRGRAGADRHGIAVVGEGVGVLVVDVDGACPGRGGDRDVDRCGPGWGNRGDLRRRVDGEAADCCRPEVDGGRPGEVAPSDRDGGCTARRTGDGLDRRDRRGGRCAEGCHVDRAEGHLP